MTFSIQHNPYLSMYQQLPGAAPPPIPPPPTDCALPRKVSGFRPTLPSRLQTLPGLDLVTSLLASCRANSNSKSKSDVVNHPAAATHVPYPPINPLLVSPSWFQQALMNSLGLPRPFVDDSCLSQTPPRPPPPPAPDATGSMLSPKLPRLMVPSPVTSKSRTSSCDSLARSDKEGADPLLYCRSTFYPLLKDQVDRAHSSWRTSDPPRPVSSDPVQETGTLVPSLIDGEVIMGFNVWGEKRLCLPHLFRFVLNDVDLKAIDEACTKLQITCTTCTPAQLKLLHSRRILPKAVSTCGLIRKSDAERLTKFLRNRMDPNERSQSFGRLPNVPNRSHSAGQMEVGETNPREKLEDPGPSPFTKYTPKGKQIRGETRVLPSGSDDLAGQKDNNVESSCTNEPIPVLHECFGRQSALIHPHLYTEPTAKCIECQTCHRFFAPDQFVGHTHTVTEVDNLNHWGFDSNNWRCYLRLHTGRRVGRSRSNGERGNSPETSEDESDASPNKYTVNADTHRRLEEFKIKFAQPIRLPPSLSAALRTVGLCASVAPIPPTNMFPPNPVPDQPPKTQGSCAPAIPVKNTSFNPQSQPSTLPTEWNSTVTGSLSSPVSRPPPISSNLSSVILPQLTLRRLWAPNDGRIKVPPPPKPIPNRDQNVLPKNLHTGPPLLLHSHRVVSQEAADQYDRDFIPNVCLMPVVGSKCRKSSCGLYGRRHRLSHGCSCKHSRNLSSGSRSRSCSSGSSSSRTRSVSISSTTSSCFSRTRSCKRYCDGSWRSPCSPGSPSSSTTDLSVQVDDRGSSYCTKNKQTSMSSTWSDSSNSRPQDNRYLGRHVRRSRRRYRSTGALQRNVLMKSSYRLLYRRVRSASPILCPLDRLHTGAQHPRSQRVTKTSTCSTTSCTKGICSPTSSEQQRSMKQRRNRAMAAAKAAQGAASRISPGLWSRHFTNLKRNNGRVLELPNARQPLPSAAHPGVNTSTCCGTDAVPLPPNLSSTVKSTTPVLVTGPNTNSLPAAVLALEAIWADLVRHINEYTFAVESSTGVQDARQRLFEQFLMMQTCYASHIAALMSENQKLHEKLASMYAEKSNTSKTNATSVPHKDQKSGLENWPRSRSMTTAPRTTESSSAKDSQAPLPLYPHRSRKEPQPTRTHFSTSCCPRQSTTLNSPAMNRRIEKTVRTSDNRLGSIDTAEPTVTLHSGQRQSGPDSVTIKINRATSSDISFSRERVVDIPTNAASSSSEDPKLIPSPGTSFKPVSETDVGTRQPWSSSEPTNCRAENDMDSHIRSHSLHSTSSAPYKVSSGLCNRRLMEKYKSERIPWKRRAWDLDGQHESYESLETSVQPSCEPAQKRRAVVQDNTGCEDGNQLPARTCAVIP